MTDIKQKPCSCCGSASVEVLVRDDARCYYERGICRNCRTQGPECENRNLAIRAWNTRHARPGDEFTGPSGEKLVAVPVEITRKMYEAWAKTLSTIQDEPAWVTDEDREEGVDEDAAAANSDWKAMLAAVKE